MDVELYCDDYLYDFGDGREARNKIGAWIKDYNEERPHSALTAYHQIGFTTIHRG